MQRVLIIGLGLIGGSFAKALRAHKIAREIFVYDFDIAAIELAKTEKIIDDFAEIDENFDLIVVATPLSAYEEIFDELSEFYLENTVVIDLGSLKEFVEDLIPDELEDKFALCHPIAGSDKTGYANSDENLFNGKKFIICNKNEAAKKAEIIAKKIGCNVEYLDCKQHDEIYALVSHLPQFLSFLTKENSPENLENDFLKNAFRLDNSNPEIWSDIFKMNEKNLEKFYIEFFDNLAKFAKEIRENKFTELATQLETIAQNHILAHVAPAQAEILGNLKEISARAETTHIDTKMTCTTEAIDSKLLFRVLIVASYLKIAKINNFKSFAGSGFKDFTSLISIIQNKNLSDLIIKNKGQILKLIEKLD